MSHRARLPKPVFCSLAVGPGLSPRGGRGCRPVDAGLTPHTRGPRRRTHEPAPARRGGHGGGGQVQGQGRASWGLAGRRRGPVSLGPVPGRWPSAPRSSLGKGGRHAAAPEHPRVPRLGPPRSVPLRGRFKAPGTPPSLGAWPRGPAPGARARIGCAGCGRAGGALNRARGAGRCGSVHAGVGPGSGWSWALLGHGGRGARVALVLRGAGLLRGRLLHAPAGPAQGEAGARNAGRMGPWCRPDAYNGSSPTPRTRGSLRPGPPPGDTEEAPNARVADPGCPSAVGRRARGLQGTAGLPSFPAGFPVLSR